MMISQILRQLSILKRKKLISTQLPEQRALKYVPYLKQDTISGSTLNRTVSSDRNTFEYSVGLYILTVSSTLRTTFLKMSNGPRKMVQKT